MSVLPFPSFLYTSKSLEANPPLLIIPPLRLAGKEPAPHPQPPATGFQLLCRSTLFAPLPPSVLTRWQYKQDNLLIFLLKHTGWKRRKKVNSFLQLVQFILVCQRGINSRCSEESVYYELLEGKRIQSMCSFASNVWYCMILQACVSHSELSIIHSQSSTHLHKAQDQTLFFFHTISSNQKY